MLWWKAVSTILVVVGLIILFISFTNMENLTGLWAAGKIQRDKEFVDSGHYRRRIYIILRVVGILALLTGCAMVLNSP